MTRASCERLRRCCKPGGKLLVYVPACPFAFGALDVALGHFRRYTPETLSAAAARRRRSTPSGRAT